MNMWLVGAGYWGQKLCQDLALFDINPRIIDIKNNQSIDDIDTPDPVILATPLWQHYDQVCDLLQRGHDVYVEKPMAETAAKIAKIQNIIQSDQICMVGHLFVHHPQLDQIKQILCDHNLGNIIHIHSRRMNWGIYQTQTDPVLSLAVHDISILLEFVNTAPTIDEVQSYYYSAQHQPDRVSFSGHADNITFDIDVSWHWPQRVRETVFIATHGQIVWNQDSNTIAIARNLMVNNRAVSDPAVSVLPYDHALTPLQCELKHWINVLQTRTQPRTDVLAAARVAAVTDQVRQLL